MYNLKEGANQQADKDSATVLVHSLFKCFTKLFRSWAEHPTFKFNLYV